MALSTVAIQEGFDYQARWFWWQALNLLRDEPIATRIGYEVDGAAGFDDVAIFYDEGGHTAHRELRADYFQVKFHRRLTGAFTAAALTEPSFIGRSKTSFLQGLLRAQREHAPTGREARFTIISPWPIDHSDILGPLFSHESGEIVIDRLAEGGPASEYGTLRARWREHLGVATDEELFVVLRTLRIRDRAGPLDDLREWLSAVFPGVGLQPYAAGRLGNSYDALPRQLLERGRNVFTRDELLEILRSERLLRGERPVAVVPPMRRVGIRSFLRWADRMREETDSMLDLVEHFDGRDPIDHGLWVSDIGPAVQQFVEGQVITREPVALSLEAHQSIAFAAGWHLDPKSGVAASVVQRGFNGTALWSPHEVEPCTDPVVWTETVSTFDGRSPAMSPDLAVVVSLSRDARAQAEAYIAQHLPSVGTLLALVPSAGVSQQCVRDAAHALRLADDAAQAVCTQVSHLPRGRVVHVFAAAPNAVMFFLGRLARPWGRCQLYEHDFHNVHPTPYFPSIALP